MTAPKYYRPRTTLRQAMRIDPGVSDATPLDPNAQSHAAIAGWMLGHGFQKFLVHGDSRPFGLAIETPDGVKIAEPGDWVIRGVWGEFYPITEGALRELYEEVTP